MERHNPQNLTPDHFGGPDGFRLLTVEEISVLTDREGRKDPVTVALLNTLAPELFSEGAFRWVPATLQAPLSPALTYRTAAPDLEADQFANIVCPTFAEAWRQVAAEHHEIMVAKGFWNARNNIVNACFEFGGETLAKAAQDAVDGQALALVGTELAEAVEAIRHGNPPDDKIPEHSGAAAELADVVLRAMDLAHARGWDVAGALVAKLEMNRSRPYLHGKHH